MKGIIITKHPDIQKVENKRKLSDEIKQQVANFLKTKTIITVAIGVTGDKRNLKFNRGKTL